MLEIVQPLPVAAVQMTSGVDKPANMRTAERLVSEAAAAWSEAHRAAGTVRPIRRSGESG